MHLVAKRGFVIYMFIINLLIVLLLFVFIYLLIHNFNNNIIIHMNNGGMRPNLCYFSKAFLMFWK